MQKTYLFSHALLIALYALGNSLQAGEMTAYETSRSGQLQIAVFDGFGNNKNFTLPDEIVQNIARHASPDTKVNLAFVSRRMAEATVPNLIDEGLMDSISAWRILQTATKDRDPKKKEQRKAVRDSFKKLCERANLKIFSSLRPSLKYDIYTRYPDECKPPKYTVLAQHAKQLLRKINSEWDTTMMNLSENEKLKIYNATYKFTDLSKQAFFAQWAEKSKYKNIHVYSFLTIKCFHMNSNVIKKVLKNGALPDKSRDNNNNTILDLEIIIKTIPRQITEGAYLSNDTALSRSAGKAIIDLIGKGAQFRKPGVPDTDENSLVNIYNNKIPSDFKLIQKIDDILPFTKKQINIHQLIATNAKDRAQKIQAAFTQCSNEEIAIMLNKKKAFLFKKNSRGRNSMFPLGRALLKDDWQSANAMLTNSKDYKYWLDTKKIRSAHLISLMNGKICPSNITLKGFLFDLNLPQKRNILLKKPIILRNNERAFSLKDVPLELNHIELNTWLYQHKVKKANDAISNYQSIKKHLFSERYHINQFRKFGKTEYMTMLDLLLLRRHTMEHIKKFQHPTRQEHLLLPALSKEFNDWDQATQQTFLTTHNLLLEPSSSQLIDPFLITDYELIKKIMRNLSDEEKADYNQKEYCKGLRYGNNLSLTTTKIAQQDIERLQEREVEKCDNYISNHPCTQQQEKLTALKTKIDEELEKAQSLKEAIPSDERNLGGNKKCSPGPIETAPKRALLDITLDDQDHGEIRYSPCQTTAPAVVLCATALRTKLLLDWQKYQKFLNFSGLHAQTTATPFSHLSLKHKTIWSVLHKKPSTQENPVAQQLEPEVEFPVPHIIQQHTPPLHPKKSWLGWWLFSYIFPE